MVWKHGYAAAESTRTGREGAIAPGQKDGRRQARKEPEIVSMINWLLIGGGESEDFGTPRD